MTHRISGSVMESQEDQEGNFMSGQRGQIQQEGNEEPVAGRDLGGSREGHGSVLDGAEEALSGLV